MDIAGAGILRGIPPRGDGRDHPIEFWLAGALAAGLLQWGVVASEVLWGPAEDSLLGVGAFAALGTLLLGLCFPVARLQADRLAAPDGASGPTLLLHGVLASLLVVSCRGAVLSISLLFETGAVPLTQLELWWEHAGPWQLQSDLLAYSALLAGLVLTRNGCEARRRDGGPEPTPEPPPVEGRSAPGSAPRPEVRRLPVRTGGEIRLVPVDEVLWIEGAGSYVRVHLEEESLLRRDTLTELSRRLRPAGFVRVHRSSIVSLRHLESLEPAGRGALRARLTDGTAVRVAASRRKDLEAALGERIGE